MIPAHWTSVIANHLWQSTLFAALAALLALALRKNHARARHWLWLIASLKFLIPFSLFVAIGSHLQLPDITPLTQHAVSVAVEGIAQPFTAPLAALPTQPASIASDSASRIPIVLFAVWVCGFIAVAFSWWRRWRSIRSAVRAASLLPLQVGVPVLSSSALLEPGVFGLFRPVLLLPEGITDRLAPAQLQAVLAHELCHVRRRDNLAAALHMAVEAIFWFHPLVWWLGARLVEERERACDEEVLRLGNQPQVYAESILRICQFYLESPLACMSGVTGSNLKQRVVRIMTQRIGGKLDFGRKLLLTAAGMTAVAGPIIFGLINAPQGRAQSQPTTPAPSASFEVASVKPNRSADRRMGIQMAPGGRFVATNIPVKLLLQEAYGVKESQISGGPSWLGSERYDVEAKADESSAGEMAKLSPEQRKERLMLMLQSLLADRFKLTLHHETKELPVYALTVAKSGPKFHETALTPADPGAPNPPGPQADHHLKGGIFMMGRGQLTVDGAPLARFADILSRQLGRVVLDQTGLKGNYDFTLKWTPDQSEGGMFGGPKGGDGGPPTEAAPPPDASGPSIFTALQEQLGLKLESQKGPVEILVIDRVERPSEN